jgi:hypothetical protein
MYLGCWESGRRPEELAKYTWEMQEDVEVLIEGVVRTIHCIRVTPKDTKTDSPDYMPLSNRLWTELTKQGWRNGFLFRNSEGNQLITWNKIMEALKVAHPDCGWFRDGRRGFCTFMVETQGLEPSKVKAVAGIKTDHVFRRYCIGSLKSKLQVISPEMFGKKGTLGTDSGTVEKVG